MTKTKRMKPEGTRCSISVSGTTYDRLRAAVPHGGIAGLVDEMVETAFDDPEILARVVARCRGEETCS